MRKLGDRMLLSTQVSAMRNPIGLILARVVPTKIGNPVIAGIAVIVASLHSFRTWTDERFQDQTMQFERLWLPVDIQADQRISIAIETGFHLEPSRSDAASMAPDPATPGRSSVAKAISRQSGDLLVGCDKFRRMGVSHGGHPFARRID